MILASTRNRHQQHIRKILLSYLCYSTPRYNRKYFGSGKALSSLFSTTTKVNSGVQALNICIIAGSTRNSGPPRPILSDRVTTFIHSSIENRDNVSHDISILKAKDVLDLGKEERGVLPLLERPHFSYPQSQIPPYLRDMHETLSNADAYITITPEYNHAPCPGLMNIMNHFGSSTFGFKPSGIVSYSAGQWGGTRAAHALRPFLSELGCLPVSAMIHIPKAAQVLNDDGRLIDQSEEEHWKGYVDRMINQLEWWGEAAKRQRDLVDPESVSPAFRKNPSQRNAPK